MGPGDDVPAALAQAGYRVTLIEDAELASGNFPGTTPSSRACARTTPRSAQAQCEATPRLRCVGRNIGRAVQHHRSNPASGLCTISTRDRRDRVTVEEARSISRIRERAFDHAQPNHRAGLRGMGAGTRSLFRINVGTRVQDRAFLQRSRREAGGGGSPVGAPRQGIFIYTGYAFFRQLPAGVPGAYRLFINLVSAR
jgi:hypothetical protein